MKKTILLMLPLIALAAGIVRAQDVAINASPIRVEHFVKQGESGTDVINLTNNGAKAVRLRVSIEEWTLDAAGTPNFMKPARRPYSCASWLKVNPVDFRIEPKQNREIRYSLTCPQGIPDGGYRAAIVFETVADVKPGEPVKKVLIQGRLAVVLDERVGDPEDLRPHRERQDRPPSEGSLVCRDRQRRGRLFPDQGNGHGEGRGRARFSKRSSPTFPCSRMSGASLRCRSSAP